MPVHSMGVDSKNWSNEDAAAFANTTAGEAKAPPERRLLFRPLRSAPEFPVDALGPLTQAAIVVQHLTQAPIAITAQSVLAATTLAVQAQRNVILPGGARNSGPSYRPHIESYE
jgi:hypothetical protein